LLLINNHFTSKISLHHKPLYTFSILQDKSLNHNFLYFYFNSKILYIFQHLKNPNFLKCIPNSFFQTPIIFSPIPLFPILINFKSLLTSNRQKINFNFKNFLIQFQIYHNFCFQFQIKLNFHFQFRFQFNLHFHFNFHLKLNLNSNFNFKFKFFLLQFSLSLKFFLLESDLYFQILLLFFNFLNIIII
jgi:hypothetical protein